ncbi:MAG: HAD family hydrolase [Phycisphaerae bacterium]
MNHLQELTEFPKEHDFFIGVDSDGCAFDTMEIKHKECFIPNTVNVWDLQPVSRFAREAAEFINLYSVHRGCNRFIAQELLFDMLDDWDEVRQRGYKSPDITSLRNWLKEESRLSSATLQTTVAETDDPILHKALEWSDAVNESVEKIVRNCPPFPFVRESLQDVSERADVIVCSSTPHDALQREWEEHDLAQYVGKICGQEQGSKKEHLKYCTNGRYEPEKVLMIGDAPGDMRAAQDNGFLYYPINPGHEADSWKRFHEEAAERFFTGRFAGEYQQKVIDEFLACLPERPPWKDSGCCCG